MNDHAKKIKEKLDKPVVLVGMMGTGKSHAARVLARGLNIPCYDSDKLIEAEQNMRVADIFTQAGEAFFRKKEEGTIINTLQSSVCVLSTGGGALTTPTVLQTVKEKAISIWIKADLDVVLERVSRDKSRPLLAVPDKKAKLQELLAAREALYAQADLTIDNSERDDRVLLEKLYKALYGFLDLR